METKKEFDQEKYWIQRHKSYKGDPRSVGTFALGIKENEAGEAQLLHTVSVTAQLLKKSYSLVLDLGCGYGRVASAFLDAGFEYTGLDISPDAIEQAKTRAPAATFIVQDLATWVPSKMYDVVCVLYVFVHFVDDERWSAFLHNVLASVRPGGMVFFADEFSGERVQKVAHAVVRPFAEYKAILNANRFEFDSGLRSEVIRAAGTPLASHFYFARRK